MDRLDNYETRPSGMDTYLSMYGWHFSKKMAKFACEKLCSDVSLVEPEMLEKICKGFDVVKNNNGYDANYLFSRFRTLFPELSETNVARLIDNWLKHNYDTATFTNFYSDCIANGIAIVWEDMI